VSVLNGGRTDGTLYFEVPQDARQVSLRYTPALQPGVEPVTRAEVYTADQLEAEPSREERQGR
jgi:hypothetical protein